MIKKNDSKNHKNLMIKNHATYKLRSLKIVHKKFQIQNIMKNRNIKEEFKKYKEFIQIIAY